MGGDEDRLLLLRQRERDVEVCGKHGARRSVLHDLAAAPASEVEECEQIVIDVARSKPDGGAERVGDLSQEPLAHDQTEVVAVSG